MDMTLTLPMPHALQAEILQSTAKRKVICAGRRIGKTTMVAMLAIHALLQGKKVFYLSTSQDQTDAFWKKVKNWLAPMNQAPSFKKNETRRSIEFAKGSIRAKTGSDPDALRGEDADVLILDECARLDPAAWFEVGAPILADRDGDAVFISTPNRKNWFYLLYNRAMSDTSGRWQAWNAASTSNPHLSRTAMSELANDMTTDTYRQEILAEFLEGGGEVFRNVATVANLERANPYASDFVAGLDWAQKNDSTVMVVMDRHTRRVVDMDRFTGVSWSLQRGRVMAMAAKWGVRTIIAEENSIGGPNIEALQAEGLPVRPFTTTAQSKPPLIENLALAIERAEIRILNDGVLTGELSAYERKVSPTTGRSQYSAPDGMHDDCVIALALAWWGVINGGIGISFA